MARRRQDQISSFIRQIERTAKRLRADVRKRAKASGLDKKLKKAAAQLEKHAKTVSGHVGKYATEIRKELRGAKRRVKRSVARRKR